MRTVVRVIDGETLALDDGSQLRLIGALAPRASDVGADPGTWRLEESAKGELRAVTLGKSIAIAFGGERSDRYGRLQAHAFVVDGQAHLWIQGHLLERGLARAYADRANPACIEEMLALERSARAARRGLWAEAAYQVRRAEAVSELRGYRGTFQVIEGLVVRVAPSRRAIYFEFEGEAQHGLSVVVRREEIALLGAYARSITAVKGRKVRTRGWIEWRRGPTLAVSHGGLIEVLEDTAPGNAPQTSTGSQVDR
jgi:endonuclease YncB( thermonuclease family)